MSIRINEKYIENYRIKTLKENPSSKFNVIFLPGGPGMGAEYLLDFANKLNLNENVYVADFPGDGNNLSTEKIEYEQWKEGLIKIVETLTPAILVTHSFSGMFTLTIPELENKLAGLIIINSAPDNHWMVVLNETAEKYNLPMDEEIFKKFYLNPSNEMVEKIFYASIPYLFLPHEQQQGLKLLENCSYNANSRIWGDTIFHPSYHYKWSPNKLPTLLIGSNDDKLLPMKLFENYEDFNRENICKLSLDDAGHFPWLSKFEEINIAITDYIISI